MHVCDVQTVTTLRQQLMIRPSTKEVTKLVEAKLPSSPEGQVSSEDVSALRADIIDIRGSLERRASTRYVEEALRRKLNKADAPLLHRAGPAAPPAPSFSDLMQVSDELKVKIERVDKRQTEARVKLGAFASQADLQRRCDALEEQLREKADKGAVEKVTQQDRGHSVVCCAVLFCSYAWLGWCVQDLRRVEDVIATHERDIIAVQLRYSAVIPCLVCNSYHFSCSHYSL